MNMRVEIGYYAAEDGPAIPQKQRLAWLRELLTGTNESLPYRAAGTLLLLYAQPLFRVTPLRTDVINVQHHRHDHYLTSQLWPRPARHKLGPWTNTFHDHGRKCSFNKSLPLTIFVRDNYGMEHSCFRQLECGGWPFGCSVAHRPGFMPAAVHVPSD